MRNSCSYSSCEPIQNHGDIVLEGGECTVTERVACSVDGRTVWTFLELQTRVCRIVTKQLISTSRSLLNLLRTLGKGLTKPFGGS